MDINIFFKTNLIYYIGIILTIFYIKFFIDDVKKNRENKIFIIYGISLFILIIFPAFIISIIRIIN